ncbi:MAG TPA: DUF3352 domain-containing protein [Gemmatimonadota bacterium]|nr:DUF3352 domain-containing protein [Gemmatimonadota bacterium]
MGTGSLLVRMVGVALFAVASVSACRGQDGGEAPVAGYETRAVATSLPAGASVVVSGYDLEAFWTRLKGTRLYTELAAIPDVREAFAPIAESQREFQAETGLALDESTLMTIFGTKFDLGFYGELPGDRADLVLVADLENEEQARTLLETLETKITEEKGATFANADVAGQQVRVAATREGDEVLLYSISDNRLVIATTRDRMQGTLSLTGDEAQTMASTGDYEAVIQKLPEATISIYVDQRALKEAADRAAAADSAAGIPEDLQSERFRAATGALEDYQLASAVGVGVYWTENGLRADAYTKFPDGERSPLAEMMTRSPSAIRTLAFQPVGTLLYGAVNSLDAQIIYNELRRYAVDATRIQMDIAGTADSLQADSLVARQLAAFESETGIDVENDIISWVGQEASFGVAGVDKTGFFPVPEVALTIATKDVARSRAFLTQLEEVVGQAAAERASIPLQWQTEEYQGQTVRYAPTPMGEGLSLSYVVTDDFVVIGSSRGLIKRMLDARGGSAQALPSNPDFGTMTAFYPSEANALGFVNLEQILTEVQGLMGTFGGMAGGAAAADTTAATYQVMQALKNAPRLGFYSDADAEGAFGHFLLEVR